MSRPSRILTRRYPNGVQPDRPRATDRGHAPREIVDWLTRVLRALGEGLETKARKHRVILNPVSPVRACLLGDDRMVATLIKLRWADIANIGFDHE